ncbi:MAG: carbohydrate binding family 9 domain-containing protein, partial [bacterium]|nr:carbohydrate binding family 9 domain-containing protein [bacterium]
MRSAIIFMIISLFSVSLFAQDRNTDKKIYYTKRINPTPPEIDGKLDDEVWRGVEWGGDFMQRSPYDGKDPSQDTSFKITYDDDNLYIAYRVHDTDPEKIENQVTRRDRFPGDWVEINLDSYYDHRTAFSFTISCSGVRSDELITEDGGNWDSSWDPVWYAETNINGDGWTAEVRIPLNQLRYADKDEQIWGLQFTRRLYRKEERSVWQPVPADAPGWVSRFGELRGIKGIRSKNSVELLPYSVSKLETSLKEAGNPFSDGKDPAMRGGLDAKFGVTSDLTLNLTVNPDFGQVEADPSVVNLSAYETFFQERRPFFVEGKNILNYQIMGGDGDFSSDNLFYSRRIGSSPHYYPDTEGNSFLDMPSVTNIASAAKLTGKTRNGYSVGVMNAVTVRETAEIHTDGTRSKETVEPMTNYFVGRLQKDYRKGDTRLGGIMTSTYRDINDSHLEFLNREAYTGGFDFVHNWKQKTYYFNYNTVFSHIKGKDEAILRAQESSVRYFQRPDADYLDLDPDATSMTGHGGKFSIGKSGNGHWNYDTGVTWRSPGLELNDVGYLRQADLVLQHIWLQFREWNPKWIFRNINVNFNQWSGWN